MVYNIIAISISALSLLVSLFVVLNSLISSSASIKITQSKENRSWILKSYDGSEAAISREENNKIDPFMESIALVEVIITNNSSLPISVLEFQMKGARAFTSYSYINNNLKVTPEYGGEIHFSSEDNPLKYLQSEFTLGPYTSMRGHILFWMESKESIQPSKHKMTILTSRKNVTREIDIPDAFESAKKYI